MSLIEARAVTRIYGKTSLLGADSRKIALNQISMAIAPGESLALLGRSGCGKSTLARLLVGLEPPDAGEICFEGRPLRTFGKADWLALRRAVQMVFQDPVGAVDPRATVGEIIAEPLRNLLQLNSAACASRVAELLDAVELHPDLSDQLPQQLSGGQLQRVCIARALAPQPRLIILDEAVSNLDMHLQIQMLDLFARLQRDHGVAYLFVTHDFRLLERFCTRLIVMENGRVAENASIKGMLQLTSDEGRALQGAVLPALPSRAHQ